MERRAFCIYLNKQKDNFAKKNKLMNLDERMTESRTYKSFRTSLDMAMGAIYVIVGVVLFTMHYFGTVELSASTAYVLGTVMLLYGAFRLYRGIIVLFRKQPRQQRQL